MRSAKWCRGKQVIGAARIEGRPDVLMAENYSQVVYKVVYIANSGVVVLESVERYNKVEARAIQ
jgi:hypothetical protein